MIRKPRAGATWRRAFLVALARGLSIAQAAREAGIDPASAHRARQRDDAFATSWAKAREKGVVRLAKGAPRLQPHEVVRASKHGRPRIQRAGPGRWSQAKEELFLETLAATANVSAACRAAGVSNAAVYGRKAREAAFAARWGEALAAGWEALDQLMLASATVAMGGGRLDTGDGEAPASPAMILSPEQAITVWKMHRAAVTGGGRRGRHDWRRETSMEEVRVEVIKRIRAIKRGSA